MFDFDSRRARCALTLLIPLFVACGGHSPAARNDSSSAQNVTGPNGMDWNGMDWNGMDWNGAQLVGISVDGVWLNGAAVTNVFVDGTVLKGTDSAGNPIAGADFVNAHLRGILSDSTIVHLRIDGYGLSADPEISLYTLSRLSPSQGWQPLCGTDGGVPIKATALAGRWNYAQGVPGGGDYISDASQFTLACEGSVLDKCTDWGYKRWKSGALANLHQACTRMVRADYCGDGTPFTTNGTAINYFDWENIATDDAPADWIGDAEWTPSGAACIANLRHPELGQPSCYTQLQNPNCVNPSDFCEFGPLLMDKIQPR